MKIQKHSYSFCALLLSVFCITRVYRNSINYDSPTEGGIWNIISLLFMGMSFLFLVGVFKRKSKIPLSMVLLFLYAFFAMAHSLFHIRTLDVMMIYNWIIIAFSPAVLFLFHCIGKTEITKSARIITFTGYYLLTVLTLIGLISYKKGILPFVMISNSYYVLCLLPLVLCLCKKEWERIAAYTASLLAIVVSEKRTGLLAVALFIGIIFLFKAFYKNNVRDFLKVALLGICALILFMIVYIILSKQYHLTLFEQLMNLLEDGGSGRNLLYEKVWNAMKASGWTQWLFGHGIGSVAQVLAPHDNVHNDFLEILYNYGIIPLLAVIGAYIALLKEGIRMAASKYKFAPEFFGCIGICLFMSMFSIFLIDYNYVACSMASLGYLSGQYQRYMGIRGEQMPLFFQKKDHKERNIHDGL